MSTGGHSILVVLINAKGGETRLVTARRGKHMVIKLF